MNVKYRNLKITNIKERENYLKSLSDMMDTGMFMMGSKAEEFEKSFSDYCNRKHAVGVASGTSALILALKTLGIKKGDEVITTTMSWLATANSIYLREATPIFVDVSDDLNIDHKKIEKAITKKTKAIIAVHFCGRLCEMDKIKKISDKNNLLLIEDASQAAGALFQNKYAGFWGDISIFSLNPMKPLGAFGEAGILVFDNKKYLDKLKSLRYLGTKDIELCIDPDINHKIDEIQSAWLIIRLENLEKVLNKRRKIAHSLNKNISKYVRVIGINEPNRTTFFEFTIECENRDELKEFLEKKGIETKIKHPILMCDQPGYKLKKKYSVPNSRRLLQRILSLPLHESLLDKEISYISKNIKNFYEQL